MKCIVIKTRLIFEKKNMKKNIYKQHDYFKKLKVFKNNLKVINQLPKKFKGVLI